MQPFEIASAAHLAGSIVLALFFVLLERHDSRPYLREWMAAWIVQVLALAALLATSRWDRPGSETLYLFLETSHGVFLWSAARGYARGRVTLRGRMITLALLVAWSAAAPALLGSERGLLAAQLSVLAVSHVAAAVTLWPLREPSGMGLHVTSNVLLLLAALYGGQAALLGLEREGFSALHSSFEVMPFLVLLLQMLLALGMVLTVMEGTQFALTATNAQLREAENRLKVLAETDPLTGCFNRRVFRDLVDDLRAERGALTGAIVYVDMDGLKELNDRDGHAAGDRAIRAVADAIRSRTRTTDLVVRFGGDEFVVVLPDASRAEAEQRERQISEEVSAAGHEVSSGLAIYGGDVDVMAAVERADALMYETKTRRKRLAAG